MLSRGCLQCSINACVTVQRERARGAAVDFTGQELSLYSCRGREREGVVLEEGRRQRGEGAVEMESRG